MLLAMNARRLLPLLLMAAIATSSPAFAQDASGPSDDEGDEAVTSAPAAAHQPPEKLRLELKQVEDERAHSSNLLPWITVGVGGGTVLVSAIAGAVHTLSCDPGCDTPNWVAFSVVAGAVVGTLGAIWLIHADADLRELDSRRYQLQEALHQYELARVRRDPTLARSSTGTFSWRFSF